MPQEHFERSKRDILLTVQQAASYLNVSVPTIKNYIYAGKLKSAVNYKVKQTHHYIAKQTHPG